MKKSLLSIVTVVVLLLVITIGTSFYMLSYALSPDGGKADVDSCYNQLFERYPDTKPWVDSLNRVEALRDTFVSCRQASAIMPFMSIMVAKKRHSSFMDGGTVL